VRNRQEEMCRAIDSKNGTQMSTKPEDKYTGDSGD